MTGAKFPISRLRHHASARMLELARRCYLTHADFADFATVNFEDLGTQRQQRRKEYEMRKGLLISALTAVAIIGASLVATPASACHHRYYGAGYGYYGGGYGYRHLAYYGGGYGYRGYGWYGRRHLAYGGYGYPRYGWYGRRHWRAWG